MSALTYTVDEFVDQVRASVDEINEESLTDAHLLDALNRAQKAITRTLTRRFDTVFMDTYDITTVAGQRAYDMPRDIFARRVEKVEHVESSGVVYRVMHISYKNRHGYMDDVNTTNPFYYDIIGNQIRIYPTPQGGLTVRLHYSKTPERLVVSQGQINSIDIANNYVILDDNGSGLTTDTTTRNAWVNICDYTTGKVKVSLQVSALDDTNNKVTFKSSFGPTERTTVFGKTIATEITSDVAADDYVCLIHGTCIPQLPASYTDYLIQHAVVHVKRRFGEVTEEEYAALKDIEDAIKRDVAGRESFMRIRKSNSNWDSGMTGTIKRIFR